MKVPYGFDFVLTFILLADNKPKILWTNFHNIAISRNNRSTSAGVAAGGVMVKNQALQHIPNNVVQRRKKVDLETLKTENEINTVIFAHNLEPTPTLRKEHNIVIMSTSEDGLHNYERVIVGLGIISSLKTEEERKEQAILREREIKLALKRGAHVCILCDDVHNMLFKQLLSSYSIQFIKSVNHISDLVIKRSEFTTFLHQYGTGFGIFSAEASFDSVICTCKKVYVSALVQEDIQNYKNEYVTGFTLRKDTGLITFLPFLRVITPYQHQQRASDLLLELVRCLDTHKGNITMDRPNWANSIKTNLESELEKDISQIQTILEPKRRVLENQQYLKSILWTKHDELKNICMKVFEAVKIRTVQNDIGIEDFWLLSGEDSKICICETKGKDGDLLIRDIIKFEGNRDLAGKDDNFPSILIANTYNNAKTFSEKERPFPSNVITKAYNNNILLLRTLDLFRLMDMHNTKKISTEVLLDQIIKRKGWLRVEDGKMRILSK